MTDNVRKRFWDTFEQMQEEFDLFFDHYAHAKRTTMVGFHTRWAPPCNVQVADNNLIVLIEIGGVEREGLDLVVEEKRLILRGRRPAPCGACTGTYERMEIAFGEFELELPLAVPVDAETAEAWYTDGFLHVVLPCIPVSKPRRVMLKIPDGEE